MHRTGYIDNDATWWWAGGAGAMGYQPVSLPCYQARHTTMDKIVVSKMMTP